MAIDNATYISELNIEWPADSDPRSQGAEQIRNLKAAIKNTFGGIDGTDSLRPNLPLGCVMMYSGTEANLTPGWAICNGQVANGVTTPNLVDRFILGAGTAVDGSKTVAINQAGGSHVYNTARGLSVAGHALTEAQIPPHRHNYVADDNHTVGVTQWGCEKVQQLSGGGSDGGGSSWGYRSGSTGAGHSHDHGLNGTNQDYKPAYYTLAYIMFVGLPS